jgi:hypothetical protein
VPTFVAADARPTAALDRLLNLPAADLEPRAAELLAALDTTPVEPAQRASIAGALLDLLADAGFGRVPVGERSLRRAMVEYVLRIGYPWALHLEADDLALVRTEVRAAVRTERRTALFVGLLAALATTIAVALWPHGAPRRQTDAAALEESQAIAAMAPGLRQRGDAVSAQAWAEACALAAREPRPCLVELRAIVAERAARLRDPRDTLRLRAVDQQLELDDVEALRRDDAGWLETAFLRPVVTAPPGAALDGAFVERAAESATLHAAHRSEALFTLARGCINEAGQLGILCRSVAGQFVVVPVVNERSARSSRERSYLDSMTGHFAFDRLDLASSVGLSCLRAVEGARGCMALLELVFERRSVVTKDPGDLLRAQNWRRAVRLLGETPER